jgi:hypothetical protein
MLRLQVAATHGSGSGTGSSGVRRRWSSNLSSSSRMCGLQQQQQLSTAGIGSQSNRSSSSSVGAMTLSHRHLLLSQLTVRVTAAASDGLLAQVQTAKAYSSSSNTMHRASGRHPDQSSSSSSRTAQCAAWVSGSTVRALQGFPLVLPLQWLVDQALALLLLLLV